MRIGVACDLGRTKRWPKWKWVVDSLDSIGHEAIPVCTPDALRDADSSGEFDLILFEQKGAGAIGPGHIRDIWRERRDRNEAYPTPWVQWWFDLIEYHHDLPFDKQHIYRTHGENMRRMDVCFINEPVEPFRFRGINAVYFDQGCPSDIGACEHSLQPEFPVVLFGSFGQHYEQRRQDVRALVSAGIPVLWSGDGGNTPQNVTAIPWTHPKELPALISRGGMVLSVDLRNDLAGFHSDRDWLAMGAGACLIRRRAEGVLEDAPCLHYETTDELIGLVRRYRDDYSARAHLGDMARKYVMEGNTYEHRVKELLKRVKGLRNETAGRPSVPVLQGAAG